MKRIYVAGPISHPEVNIVLEHIRRGIELSARVLEEGFSPFCPWLDHQFLFHRPFSITRMKRYSMDWLEVCDAVLVCNYTFDGSGDTYRWSESKGTMAEIERATQLGIPVYYSLTDLKLARLQLKAKQKKAAPN